MSKTSLVYRKILCPAKLNLILRIDRPRKDGFHPIESLMVPLSWGDRLTVEISRCCPEIFLSCPGRRDLQTPDNLVVKATELFLRETGVAWAVDIELQKIVPTGAGLGGGSSDAAQMLMLLADAFAKMERRKISRKKLIGWASRLGSDVAFFLEKMPAWCKGRGEICDPIFNFPKLSVVLILPKRLSVPTPWAYRTLDKFRASDRKTRFLEGKMPSWIREGNFSIPPLRNDFETSLFLGKPALLKFRNSLAEAGAWAAGMSGSGSTLYGVFRDTLAAKKAAGILKSRWKGAADVVVTRTT